MKECNQQTSHLSRILRQSSLRELLSGSKRRLCLILLLALITRLVYIFLFVDPEYDGYERFVKGIQVLSDPFNIVYHWCWLPLFQYIDAGLYWLTRSYFSVRVFSALCGSSSVLVVHLLARRVSKSESTAQVASILMAFNPMTFTYDTMGMTEPLFNLLILVTLYLLIGERPLLSSLPLAAACLLRYEAWFLIPFFYAVAVIQRRLKLRAVPLALILPALSIFSWLYLNHLQYGNAFEFVDILDRYYEEWWRDFPKFISPLEAQMSILRMRLSPFWYIITSFIFLTPTVFMGALRGILRRAREDKDKILMASFAVFYLALLTYFTISGKSLGCPRYCIPIIPPFIVFAAYHVTGRDEGLITQRRFLARALILSLAFLSVMTAISMDYIRPVLETSSWLRENTNDRRILCIRTPIIVLSGLPTDRFTFFWGRDVDRTNFLKFLEDEAVTYVVSRYDYFSNLCGGFPVVFASEGNTYTVYRVPKNLTGF